MKKNAFLLSLIFILVLLSGCGEEIVLETPSDLIALRVGAVNETAGESYANSCGAENVTVFNSVDEAVEALAANEIDCVITDLNTAKDIASEREDITTTETRIIQDTEYCAAVRTDDFDTLAVAEVATAEVKKDTNFTKMCRGYIENLGEERDAFITNDQVGSSGTLTLGTTISNPPYAYVTPAGKVAGIAVEYAKSFAAKRDQTLEVRVYESKSDLSKALRSGEIDLYFESLPVPAVPGVSYSTTCYTVELRVLVRDK